MNSVSIMGRLTKDPTIRVTAGTNPITIATFTLAVQDDYDNKKADFVSCKAFGKTAELVEKYCHKGDFIGLTGKISTGSYEKDGKKVYTMDVNANHLTFTPKIVREEPVKEDAPAEVPQGFTQDDDIPF